MTVVTDRWQAAEARQHFSEVVDAAVDGRPQFVRRRDGKEVVIVSHEYFELTRPNLKNLLLTFKFGDRNDDFEQALKEAREAVGAALLPRNFEQEPQDGNPGHQRSE